jgi:hypothetical protein
MKCVILQPSYIPWRGYFHQIWKADCFIFFDDVQYDRRGWRNRNRIKTAQGTQWLTIPVLSKGCQVQNIRACDIRISTDMPWRFKHWQTLEQSYGKAPYFEHYAPLVKRFYATPWENLCDFTIEFTTTLARELGMKNTQFMRSSTLQAHGAKTDRLVSLLKQVGATHYITGPAARVYIEENKFWNEGISVEYMEYNYPEYQQFHPPYDPQVSILDLMFMTGPKALDHILGTAQGHRRNEKTQTNREVFHESN